VRLDGIRDLLERMADGQFVSDMEIVHACSCLPANSGDSDGTKKPEGEQAHRLTMITDSTIDCDQHVVGRNIPVGGPEDVPVAS